MAAATFYSELFSSTTKPTRGRPKHTPMGSDYDFVTYTYDGSESLNETGDRVMLIPLPHGARLTHITVSSADLDTHATPLLDQDLVWSDGTTDVIIYNAGTAFQSALAVTTLIVDVNVTGGTRGFASIDSYVNTGAATPADAAINLIAFWDYGP